MKPPTLQLKSVTKIYGGDREAVVAVQDLTLEVLGNEIVCLVGPSGCGKTTTINLIAGFDPPTLGKVLVEGDEMKRADGTCGVVFQTDAVFPWMTVEHNVAYGLKSEGSSPTASRQIVMKYLDLVGLHGFGDRWPRELSGGMRKRVDLARAYASNPDVLLLDEPFASLDVLTKEEMQLALLRIWGSEKKTVLFVTHDVEEAIFLGHRVAVMTPRPGTIKQIFPVQFPMPRKRALKFLPEFLELRRSITECLGVLTHPRSE